MKSRTNLVILTPGFPAGEMDSTTIPSLQIYLRNLKAFYPDVDLKIIAFHYPVRCDTYYWNGIPVIAAGGKLIKGGRIFLWYRILSRLFILKKEYGIDIMHAFWLGDTALIGLLFKILTGVPLVITAMGQDVKNENRYLSILRLFQINLIFISKFQAEYNPGLSKRGLSKIIPFGIDHSYFMQPQIKRNIDILAVGSLNQVKNYYELIDIIQLVLNSCPRLHCIITGKGSERFEIEQYITKRGLEKIIILTGELSYEKVILEMCSCKILLHTSHFEGQGLVITEALASGAYVVCYPTGIAKGLKCKKLLTGSTKYELSDNLVRILSDKDPDFSPEYFYTIKDTCSEYMNVYLGINSVK